MKNSIKRAQSQARLSFAERENFRPKVKQLKKTLLTLVALLAVTTGAWADETPLLTIENKDNTSFKSGSKTFDDKVTVTFSNEVINDGDDDGWYAAGPITSLLTVAGTNGYTITSCKFYTKAGTAKTGYTVEGESPSVYLTGMIVYTDANQSVSLGTSGITKIEVFGAAASAASGPEVAWNKTAKTGTFTMPGGNVTLEPEYYPQAALTAAPTAINDVPATTDGAIVKAGTVANIGSTENAQGTVMYYVSPTDLDDAALLALAADQWTADVPTAESLAEGQAYVYYYVRGNDSDTDEENFSDGDILAANALTVTIAAEPTYAVTFAEGTDANEWTASPNTGVKKGETVTVTYNGSKKVIGVKAEKKKRPEFVPGATIQNLESFVEVENNRDGTITLHMPTLKPSTYNVTGSTISNGEHTLHFGYEKGSGTNMSSIGANIITKSWNDHTPFSELDKTIDITSGEPRVAIMITGHVRSATCPAPGKEHYWGLYRYTNPVKVTYNLGGGSISGSTADKVEYLFSGDALATTFAAPTREGYTFDGWYTSAEGGTKLTASNATSATTIYAHWNAIAE